MVLRLVLVGLVAGLGFTFPGRRDIDTLSRSAQRWVRAQVAAWEAQRSPREATFVFLADLPAPAPSEAAQPVVSDQVFSALVDEMVVEFVQAELASRPRDAEETLKPTAEIAPVDASESLAIAPPCEPAVAEPGEPAEPATSDLAFQAIVDEMATTFTADLAAIDSVTPTDAAINELMDALALEPPLIATPLERPEPTPPAAVASEPLEVAEELYAGEAYELNRISEFPEPTTPTPAAELESRQSRLTNAVRLTREAVYAWTSLLHGPAVVTIAP